MNRWLWIGSLAGLLVVSTGCLRHQTRSGGCSTGACASSCSTGECGDASCGGGKGILGKLTAGKCASGDCGSGGCRTGCVAGSLGWQQGGHDYSSHMNPGLLGHGAGARMQSQQFTPGPPTGQVAYPYYTVRGPRDFLVNDPPTIGR